MVRLNERVGTAISNTQGLHSPALASVRFSMDETKKIELSGSPVGDKRDTVTDDRCQAKYQGSASNLSIS